MVLLLVITKHILVLDLYSNCVESDMWWLQSNVLIIFYLFLCLNIHIWFRAFVYMYIYVHLINPLVIIHMKPSLLWRI